MSQAIIPMLSYEDGPAAMDWLARAFGFVEATRWLDDDGRLTHGELYVYETSEAMVMLATPSPDYQSPKTLRAAYPPAERWLSVPYIVNGVLVYVPDIDAHFARAVEAGATILSPITQGPPGRGYRAEDLEGQRWFFLERG